MNEKTKILVIDDEEDFSHFIKLNLESTNKFEVFTSTTGKEGIKHAKINKP
ncbi:MAG: two-component system response regulator, partial [Deltaproteobacteria bacterium]|nr:two-component system response regulator [Deltaproteobacteria bacterium]